MHVAHGIPRINDLDAWAIRHENGVHLEIDDNINPEDATSVLFVLLQQSLRAMYRYCLDVLALLGIRPELDGF